MTKRHNFFLFFFFFLNFCSLSSEASFVADHLEKLYCGKYSCYELLGVERSASSTEIKKAYRKKAVENHPDKNKREDAHEIMQRINKAYSVLSNPEVRETYNYSLDNPEDVFALLYGIRAVYPQRTHPLFVIILVIFFISLGQWVHNYYDFTYLRNIVKQGEEFQRQLKRQIEENYPKWKKMSEKELKPIREEYTEMILENIAVDGKVVKRIGISDLLFVRIFFWPQIIIKFLYLHVTWIWKFSICRQPYGDFEKIYITKQKLNLDDETWEELSDQKKNEYLELQLYDKKKYDAYLEDLEDKEREERVNSARYRQMKRWKKKGIGLSYNYDED